MIGWSPRRTHGSPPLDEPQPTEPRAETEPPPEPELPPELDPKPSAARGPAAPREDPPGLRAQIGATRESAKRLVGAHVELAKAEFGEIGDEIKRISVLIGIAIGAAIVAGLLVTVGMPLFLGEWIFGSIGWGLLHGLLFLAAIGISAVVLALGVEASTAARSVAIGVIVGLVVGVVLGLNLTNRGWGLVGDSLLPLSDPGARPLAAALVVLPVVLGLLFAIGGLVRASRGGASRVGAGTPSVAERVPVAVPTALFVGWLAAFLYAYSARVAWPDLVIVGVGVAGFVVSLAVVVVIGGWRPGFAFVTGLAIGTAIGVVLAGVTALGLGPRVGAAIGVTVGLGVWIGTSVAALTQNEFDGEAFMNRFKPQKTIDMTKETIEWARARMPLSRRS